MKYISVSGFAKKWNIPERTVRYNCSSGKIIGCFLTGKTWNIPEDAVFPLKSKSEISGFNNLLRILKEQKGMKLDS